MDEYGRQAGDYPADDPVHAEYLGLYREMGMDDAKARAFYALTNSTPFDHVRYLTRGDMARFVTLDCGTRRLPFVWADGGFRAITAVAPAKAVSAGVLRVGTRTSHPQPQPSRGRRVLQTA